MDIDAVPERSSDLKRSLSLPVVLLYGLGTTIGAGIYALTGAVAGKAGMLAPVSFAAASCLAGFTALSFAELSARLPRSAGEAVYVQEGFGSARLATIVGLLVAAAGCVSAATIINGFAGYWQALLATPRWLPIGVVTLGVGAVAAWGIEESSRAAAAITVIEMLGLLLVVWAARHAFGELPQRLGQLSVPPAGGAWTGIGAGALLAFYAFLGFEDMVNIAEEVRDVERVLPIAIVLTLAITTVIYVAVAAAAVLVVDPTELARSSAPLSLVVERGGGSAALVSLISLLAMTNGGLIQIIMASRVLFGLARQGALPRTLGTVHARTRTPLVATAAVTAAVLGLALWFPLAPLAAATSTLTLAVFTAINLALVRLKRRTDAPVAVFRVPLWIPLAGAVVTAAFFAYGLSSYLSHAPVAP